MDNKIELKTRILEGVITVFNQKGLKFTMDDIAAELGISKKTIYTVFADKTSMFYAMVDYIFDQVKESEARIMEDPSLTTRERLEKILIVLPESYQEVDFRKLYELESRYPEIYEKVAIRLETGWENTYAVLTQGMEEGCFRRVPLSVIQSMVAGTIEQFLTRQNLQQEGISYMEGLQELVRILMDGIAAEQG